MTLGVAGYAAGHAALALAAGSLAQAFSRGPLSIAGPYRTLDGSVETLTNLGLAAAFVKATTGTLAVYCQRSLSARAVGTLRTRLVEDVLANGASLPASRVVATLSVRLREVETALFDGVFTRGRAVVQLVPLAAALVLLAPDFAGLAALAALPFALALGALRGRARRATARSQSLAEELECGVDELVRHVDLWRAYGAGSRVVRAVEAAHDRAARASAGVEAARAALSSANEVVAALALVGVAALAGRSGAVDVTPLVPFAAVFFMAYRPLRDSGDARSFVLRGEAALAALAETVPGCTTPQSGVSRTPPPPAPPDGVDAPRRLPPRLELEAYGAAHRGPTTTLAVEPGEIVCIVGPTGSGKTTLLRTLLGLEPARGRLLVDGRDATRAPAGPELRPFAWVPQEAPLVTGTLLENVLLVGSGTGAAMEALAKLGAAEMQAKAGTEQVGPGGRALSGGERRQVALARALSSPLPVLLLDEPTEGLDAAAARKALAALRALRGERSVVIVTHREDVLDVADRVVQVGAPHAALAAE